MINLLILRPGREATAADFQKQPLKFEIYDCNI